VVPRELLQNIQAQSPDDIYKLNPSTRTTTPQITSWTPMVSIRGFDGYNIAEDGLRRSYNHAAVVEDKERVEILSGLSGFLFGAAPPGGMINYVYKRPTLERLNSVTVGNYGGSQGYVHGDFGGRFDEAGRAGYRLNVVKQRAAPPSTTRRSTVTLVSAAADWQVTDKLLLEFNAVYNKLPDLRHLRLLVLRRRAARPRARRQEELGPALDQGRVREHQADQQGDLPAQRPRHAARRLHARQHRSSGAGPHDEQRVLPRRLQADPPAVRAAPGTPSTAASAMADISFNTGPIAHKLTLGYYMYSDKSWSTDYAPSTGYEGPYPFNAPTYVPEAQFPPNTTLPYYAGRVTNTNYVIGDNIQFNDQWSVIAGINRSNIRTQTLDSSGARLQPDYDKRRNSPSISLVFKPVPWLSTYASYIEGLEQGGVAPETATNARAILPPMVSKQKEIGLKATVGDLLLTTALFDIEKAYEFTDGNNTYTQNGRQNHKGIEFSASGKITSKWTVVSGVTALDAKVKGSDFNGNSPQNVAKVIAKIYSEYELPVPGLTLTGGIYYTGKQWADAGNTDRLPAVTTADIGIRYATKAAGKPLTLRLNVANVTNKSYWLNSYYTGAPRSVAFSAQLQF
jgi:iron complex outermembrane receptor protein